MGDASKGTRFLSAVFALVVLITAQLPYQASAAEAELAPGASEQPVAYQYAVEIEFSSFAFYYDYGTWNVNTMTYEADKSSEYPAASTISGCAGWYGFDGVSNKIRVTNYTDRVDKKIKVELKFEIPDAQSSDADHFVYLLQPGCIHMDAYEFVRDTETGADDWTNSAIQSTVINNLWAYQRGAYESAADFLNDYRLRHIKNEGDDVCRFFMESGMTREVFLSFSGAPKMTDGSDFTAGISAAVGFLTLKIGFEDDL